MRKIVVGLLFAMFAEVAPPGIPASDIVSGKSLEATDQQVSQQDTRSEDGDHKGTEAKERESVEVIGSVYDRGLEFSARASAAADSTMAHYPHESFLRWRPVDLRIYDLLPEGHLSVGALPDRLSFSLFQDLKLVADKTSYDIFESTGGAMWWGRISGSEQGWVEVTVVGSEDSPDFMIRIFDYPRAFSVLQAADMPDAYIAVGWSSDRSMSFD